MANPNLSSSILFGTRAGLIALVLVSSCKSDGGGGGDAAVADAPVVPPAADSGMDGATGDGPAAEVPPAFSKEALLGAIGSCVLSTVSTFEARLAEAEAAITAWRTAPDATTLAAARAAFLAAQGAWQVAETVQVGPGAPNTQPGGQNLRDHIYSWPLASACAVEEEIVAQGYATPAFANALVNRRGLDALEYLLFVETDATSCPPTSPIVAGGTWAALDPATRQARKRDYAVAAVADLRARTRALAGAWEPAGGNFAATLATAGPGNPVFGSTQLAFNAISDALFYIEQMVKDTKLARPLGLRDCPSPQCPERVETPLAKVARDNLGANLRGFRQVFQGCGDAHAGVGFDDWLVAVGAGSLAEAFIQRFAAVEVALGAVEENDLAQALAVDAPSVRAVHDAFKGITDLLKTQFVTVLDLELPKTIQGDND